ncbi:MAG: hypothetical protein AAF502_12265 [Bacteroidota bacterium]
MRPFRFFFVLSLGIIIFYFVARVLIFALFAAAILSFGYFLFRKIRSFFFRLDWDGNGYYQHQQPNYFPNWRYDREPLFSLPYQPKEVMPQYRKIEIQ